MSCGCTENLKDGMAIVDHVKFKKKDHMASKVVHEIHCECGERFQFTKVIMNCPNCEMTYAVTPCGSADKENIKKAGIKYA